MKANKQNNHNSCVYIVKYYNDTSVLQDLSESNLELKQCRTTFACLPSSHLAIIDQEWHIVKYSWCYRWVCRQPFQQQLLLWPHRYSNVLLTLLFFRSGWNLIKKISGQKASDQDCCAISYSLISDIVITFFFYSMHLSLFFKMIGKNLVAISFWSCYHISASLLVHLTQ